MQRRAFVGAGLLALPGCVLGQTEVSTGHGTVVSAGQDRFGEVHTLGFSSIGFKVSPADTGGGLFVMEHGKLGKGGPFRHLHPEQDEWMYAMEGEFRVEVGDEKVTLKPGDSVLMPRKVPDVWAQVGDTPGKLLVAFTPAGNMEAFFRDFGKTGKLPTDASVLHNYGLVRLGPPLPVGA